MTEDRRSRLAGFLVSLAVLAVSVISAIGHAKWWWWLPVGVLSLAAVVVFAIPAGGPEWSLERQRRNWVPYHKWAASPDFPFPLSANDIGLGIHSSDCERLKVYLCEVYAPDRSRAASDTTTIVFWQGSALDRLQPAWHAQHLYPKDFADAPSHPLQPGIYRVRWYAAGDVGRILVRKDKFKIRKGRLVKETPGDQEVTCPDD